MSNDTKNTPTQLSSDLFIKVDRQNLSEVDTIQRPSVSYWVDAWNRLKKNYLAVASACFIVLLTLAAFIVPLIIPYNHIDPEQWNRNLSPSLGLEALVVGADVPYEEKRLENTGSDGEEEAAYEIPTDAPGIPTLNLVGIPSIKGITITWEPVKGAERYQLYRSINPSFEGVPQGDIDYDVLSYHDRLDLTAKKTYYYRLRSTNMMGESDFSEPLAVKAALALNIDQASKFKLDPQVGDQIKTFAHYFGTDDLGRDILARCMYGAKISLFIGFVAPLIYMIIGVIFGAISGFVGGFVDDLMMRVADTVSTVPDLLAVIMLQVFLGSGVHTLLVAIVMVGWARSARQIRGEVLRLREMEFIHAAGVLGTPFRKIIFRHLIPNVSGTILVLFTLAIPGAIFTEAFLSFIGLGIAPPAASWGTITVEGAKVFLTYPHQLLAPATLICVTIFSFNMLGDGLRDALDPKLRGTK